MWIFTRYGFFSIACASKTDGATDPDKVMVRARMRQHLVSLKERFPDTELGKAEIQSSERTDYRHRIVVSKAAWVAALAELATEQTWANFKNEASRFSRAKKTAHAYVDALHGIWDVMHRLQLKEAKEVAGARY
jgi:predicted small integral membrane protein